MHKIGYLICILSFLSALPAESQNYLGAVCAKSGIKKINQPSSVQVIRAANGKIAKIKKIKPYGKKYFKAIRCIFGDINNDGAPEIIVSPGPGGKQMVKVFNPLNGKLIEGPVSSFFAFQPSFSGGVYVAAGDVNGDGFDDIIASAGSVAPQVNVFNGQTGEQITFFNAYESTFTGGVRVAAADITGDGKAEIVTGPGSGRDAHVRIFNGETGAQLNSFFAYEGFTGGVNVAAGDINSDGRPDIIVGRSKGAPPEIRVFNEINNEQILSFFAFPQKFMSGVSVAAADLDLDGDVDILTGPEKGKQGVKFFSNDGTQKLSSFFAFGKDYKGGVFVAAID